MTNVGYRRRKWEDTRGQVGAWIAETDFGTAPSVRAALHAAVESDFLTYTPERLACDAERACSEFLDVRYGWTVPSEWIHLVPDVLAALRVTIELYTRPESAVVVPTPCYPPFLTVPLRAGREIVEVPASLVGGRWRMDMDAIDRAFAAGAGLLILCNPHNPLGEMLDAATAAQLRDIVERHGGRVFADEIHAPIVYPGARHMPYASLDAATASHTITATATSKGWNIPGLKCAQLIVSNDADEGRWRDADSFPHLSASILGAVAAIAAYRDGIEWLDAIIDRLDHNRALVGELLATHVPSAQWHPPPATYLAWIRFSADTMLENPAAFFARRAGVILTDGGDCGVGGSGAIRLNYGTEPEILTHAIRSMADAVDRGHKKERREWASGGRGYRHSDERGYHDG